MNIPTQILEIYETNNFSNIKLRVDKLKLWDWVLEHCDPVLIDNGKDIEKFISAVNKNNIICENGKQRKLVNSKEGRVFKFCSASYAECQCRKEFMELPENKLLRKQAAEKQHNTLVTRYGENFGKQRAEKAKGTFQNKYGVDNPAKSELIKIQVKKQFDETYGGHPMTIGAIKEKHQSTMQERYGVKFAQQSPKIKKKTQSTVKLGKENNKDYYKNINEKRSATCQTLFGVDNAAKSTVIQKQIKETNLQKRGTSHWKQEHFAPGVYDILADKNKFIDLITYFSVKDVCNLLNVCNTLIYRYHDNYDLEILTRTASQFEDEIYNFLEDHQITSIRRSRKIIKPQELDLYIPDFKLAIEHNGLFWHSEWGAKTPKNYHKIKTDLCKKQGVELVHIFSDEWIHKTDICKSVILSKVGKAEHKLFARNCTIEEIANKDLRQFLDSNHLQGFAPASTAIVLKNNNEIVLAMTFGKPRYNKNIQFEMIRLTSKLNTNVIGGTQKLWAYFIKKYAPASVVSYCDRRWFTGDIYSKLHFVKNADAVPTYWYTNYKERFHRSKFQKHKLIKMGYDKNKTENEIVQNDLNLDKIWDCGQDTWIWRKI